MSHIFHLKDRSQPNLLISGEHSKRTFFVCLFRPYRFHNGFSNCIIYSVFEFLESTILNFRSIGASPPMLKMERKYKDNAPRMRIHFSDLIVINYDIAGYVKIVRKTSMTICIQMESRISPHLLSHKTRYV